VEVSEKWRKDRIVLPHVIKQIVWHRKGDYLATVNDTEGAGQVMMHQISKSKSQVPFSRHSGVVNQIAFHPTKPYFFVAVSYLDVWRNLLLMNSIDATTYQNVQFASAKFIETYLSRSEADCKYRRPSIWGSRSIH